MIPDILRWIALPIAGYYIPTLTLALLLSVTLGLESLGGQKYGHILRNISTVVAYFIFGTILVIVARWIAPNHKEATAMIAALYTILESWRRCVMYKATSSLAYPNAIAGSFGAITAGFLW